MLALAAKLPLTFCSAARMLGAHDPAAHAAQLGDILADRQLV